MYIEKHGPGHLWKPARYRLLCTSASSWPACMFPAETYTSVIHFPAIDKYLLSFMPGKSIGVRRFPKTCIPMKTAPCVYMYLILP